jgi:hypothetical protein
MFTYVDVLERAIQIVQRGNPPFSWSDHGECCPWCAASIAKGELDNEHGTGVSFSHALEDYLYGEVNEVESDEPLVFARKALGQWNDIDLNSITREKAITILSQAKSVIVIDAPNTASSGQWGAVAQLGDGG